MMRKTVRNFALAVGIVTLIASTASAAVLFYPNGDNLTSNQGPYGFVGKGDVQTAFGWNNHQLQQNAEGVSFAALYAETITQVCGYEDTSNVPPGPPDFIVTGTRFRLDTVDADVAYDLRKATQITGFNLMGVTKGEEVEEGDWQPDPNSTENNDPGNMCPVGSHPKGATSSSGEQLVGFFVIYNGTMVQLTQVQILP